MKQPIAIVSDHGHPPDSVTQQNELLKAALASGSPVSEPNSAPTDTPEETPNDTPSASAPIVVDPRTAGPPIFKKIERVELEYVPDKPDVPSFNLSFAVGEVCYREHYVSMLIVSDLGFKPTTTMKFNMKHGGKIISVIFAGAEFEFQTLGIRGISFLVDKKRQHDQTR